MLPTLNHESPALTLTRGTGPVVAAAIHDGHEVRPEIRSLLALSDAERRREEDPYTGRWTGLSDTRIVGRRSRFEVDLNRPRESAVYRSPEDAWGLRVWTSELPDEVIERSLEVYDEFYATMEELLAGKARRNGRFVVYDLHSYNHRREGPDAPAADADANPEVNIGTGSMDRERWAPVVDRLIADLRGVDFCGRRLDVRENVKFRGGEFPTWVHREFPASGCAIAIEFKKFFMDEWTGEPYEEVISAIGRTLEVAADGTRQVLESL